MERKTQPISHVHTSAHHAKEYGKIFYIDETPAFRIHLENELGLHMRPASLLVKTSNKYDCSAKVYNETNQQNSDVKSIMGLMTLSASKGHSLRFEAEGSDALACLEDLLRITEDYYFNNG